MLSPPVKIYEFSHRHGLSDSLGPLGRLATLVLGERFDQKVKNNFSERKLHTVCDDYTAPEVTMPARMTLRMRFPQFRDQMSFDGRLRLGAGC